MSSGTPKGSMKNHEKQLGWKTEEFLPLGEEKPLQNSWPDEHPPRSRCTCVKVNNQESNKEGLPLGVCTAGSGTASLVFHASKLTGCLWVPDFRKSLTGKRQLWLIFSVQLLLVPKKGGVASKIHLFLLKWKLFKLKIGRQIIWKNLNVPGNGKSSCVTWLWIQRTFKYWSNFWTYILKTS